MSKQKTIGTFRNIRRSLATPKLSDELHARGEIKNTLQPLLKQFYKNSDENDLRLKRLAKNYLQLKQDLTERQRLYVLDAGADMVLSPMELSRRAAARAGLQLPKLDPDLERK
jgi:hypothetical protein